jgi:TonB family protein
MRKMKVLIVDFDDDSILALSEYLKAEGFHVIVAGDGEAGLEKCKAEYPDLVIVEPMISKLHGFELCSIITHDFNGHIPVIILTKFYREEQFKIEATSAYGAAAFLSKPFKGPEILSTIKDLLKEKIKEKEDEDKDMAEDTQNLDDFSESALENLKIDTKTAEVNLQMEEIDNEILEPVSTLKNAPEKEEKSPDIRTQIDKMLEDTLSEFGLNLQKSAPPKSEEKRSVRPETPMAAVEEHLMADQEEDRENSDIPVKEDPIEPVKESILVKSVERESQKPKEMTEPASANKEEKIFSAMEDEEKATVSPIAVLKNSLTYLKKLPLKFIIPLILVAAVALSASFIFRRAKGSNPTPQNMTSAIQPVQKETSVEPDDVLKEEAVEEEESPVALSSQGPPEKPAAQTPKEAGAEVKTKVNEVFAVNDPESRTQDIESVNLEEDVLAETEAIAPEPILTQKIPATLRTDMQESLNTLSASPSPEQNSMGSADNVPEKEQTIEDSQPNDDSNPVKTGDLIPLADVDIEPEIAKRVDPKYPGLGFQRGVEGKVVINVLISETGDVIETALIRGMTGPYGFNEECDKAVRQWKFVPAFKSGAKVKVWKTISFTFKKS